jgi:hypothetical protein
MQLLMFLQFGGYTLVRNSKDLFESFGFEDQPVIIGLIIFQVCLLIFVKNIFFLRYTKSFPSTTTCLYCENSTTGIVIFHLSLQWLAFFGGFLVLLYYKLQLDWHVRCLIVAHYNTCPAPSEFLSEPCQSGIWISGSFFYFPSKFLLLLLYNFQLHLPWYNF